MKTDINESEEIRRYLLGRLPPPDVPTFEERFFVDSELYEELSIVEDELIDEYLRGELSSADRESFESHFMCAPGRQERVRFARALKKFVTVQEIDQPQPEVVREKFQPGTVDLDKSLQKKRPFFPFAPFQNPIASYALTAAMLLIVAGVAWMAWKNLRNPAAPETGSVLAVVLTPGLSRSEGETKRIAIPADKGTVLFQLQLAENQYQAYEASLMDSGARTLATKKNLKSETTGGQPAVAFDVPADLMPPGDYRVKLSGVTVSGVTESVASYSFRVLNP